MKYKTALLIGRFQPFHFGHLYLIKKTLEISEKIIVGICSASIFSKDNPLDFETRKKTIEKVFVKEKINDKLLKIVALEDFFDDKKWLENVKKQAGDFDIIVSNNEWTNSIMEKAGYKVIRFPYYKRHLYEGWRIRKLIRKGEKWEDRVPKYLIFNLKFSIFNLIKKIKEKKKIFKNIAVAGTFDHFHKGHRALLKSALKYGKKIIVGITSDNFVKNKNLSKIIENFNIRKNNVSNFLKKQKDFYKALIIKINNFIGDLDKRKNIEAIVVSKNTYFNALKINEIREKNNLKKLRIIICSDVFLEDGKIISSERIRKGEIDRDGKNYWFFLESFLKKEKKELVLPENLKKELRKPLGKILKNIDEAIKFIKNKKPLMIVSVGDIITKSLLEKKINPNLKIIDFKSRRKFIEKKEYINIFEKKILLKNNPGTINLKTAEKIKIFFENFSCQKPFFIIDGEEDLLALPAILFVPLNCLVFYGHFQYGIIGVVVSEKIKKHVVEILIKFN